jgi:hypothetical protein
MITNQISLDMEDEIDALYELVFYPTMSGIDI